MVLKTAFQLHSTFFRQGTSSKIVVLSDSANESRPVKILNKRETWNRVSRRIFETTFLLFTVYRLKWYKSDISTIYEQ